MLATFVVNNTNDDGSGSLRDAMELANASANSGGADQISFAIPGSGPHLIQPLTRLPMITDAVIVDATTQPGYTGSPVVQVDGDNSRAYGFVITRGPTRITGLSVTGFTDSGIWFYDSGGSSAIDNYLGIGPSGAADGNYFGIKVTSRDITIRGNVVSGNLRNGVFIVGSSSTRNVIRDNRIGTDPSGTLSVPNGKDGVSVFASLNVVADNLISGNGGSGIYIHAGVGTEIRDNVIGLNAAGDGPLGNTVGVLVHSFTNFVTGNTISGNQHGVVISREDSRGNDVHGNMIGTDPSGTFAIGNQYAGVAICNASLNHIGGLGASEANVISGNGSHGVLLTCAGTTDTEVTGNKIGVDITGTVAIPNDREGVRIVQGASDNFVESNQISGNGRRGVAIAGATTSGNVIRDNQIGTDAAGTGPLHNSHEVAVQLTAPRNVVERNLISAVDAAIVAYTRDAIGNTISENDIGTQPLLATNDGIHLLNAASNTSIVLNTIAGGERGIILTGAGEGNDMSANVILGMSQIAIDLGGDGVTPNDGADADEGPNRLQNTPQITQAVFDVNLQITYFVSTLRSIATYPMRVEFFATGDFFATADGQARVFLGTDLYTGPDRTAGAKTITLGSVASRLMPGDRLTATATDADGNTSELSLGFVIAGIPT